LDEQAQKIGALEQEKKILQDKLEFENDTKRRLTDVIEQIAAEKAQGPERFDPAIAACKAELHTASREVLALDQRFELLDKNVRQASATLTNAQTEQNNAILNLKQAEEQKRYLLELKRIFGPAGIRAFVFDGIIRELNARIAGYLSTLSSGSLTFEITPDDQKGKFVEACRHNGVERSVNALSGGEQRRLSLAADLALSDVVQNRLGITPDCLFLDEALNGLDITGKEAVMTLLQDMATRKTVYLVDHASEMKSAFSEVFKLAKRNGSTTVE
jgi:DNA repair exonuclease SbcCD ATPase subunit